MKQTFKNTVEVTKNSFQDNGDGIVEFPNGLVISDDQVQRNGTRYDIDSLDISQYGGQLTADHEDKLKNIIGKVEGVKKKDGKVIVDRIIYAVKQNPYARLAYDLLTGGFSKAFSTETMGAPANDMDGTLSNHELVGLSQVVTPNNYSAVVNTVHNSLEKAKQDGLDITGIEEKILNSNKEKQEMSKTENEITDEQVVELFDKVDALTDMVRDLVNDEVHGDTIKEEIVEEIIDEQVNEAEETEDGEVEVEENDAEPETEEAEPEAEVEENDAEPEAEEELVENEITDEETDELFEKLDILKGLVEKLHKEEKDIVEETKDDTVEEIVIDDINNNTKTKENSMDKEEIRNMLDDMLKGYFAKDAKEPEFSKAENSIASMDWKERYTKQVNAAYDAFRLGNIEARKTLNEINEINFNALKEEGIAKNSMTIASMGNFVIPPELYREIIGKRSDYSALINATDWRETNSLEFGWLRRNGDIDMQNVVLCDDGNDGNLKPMSEYSATPESGKLEEIAAVTVVCNAATRFLAVDLLADVAAGYRNDYDRKRAQLVIAKFEQAIAETGQEVAYAPESDAEAMIAWLQAISEVSDSSVNGTLIFNNKTFAQLKAHALHAGVNGPLGDIFLTGEVPTIFGTPFIVVPNDLMPSLESDEVVSFKVDGEDVVIKHAAFYADLSEFVGYTSGGLQYDISSDASYEVNGQTRSAYQRNELVLRGSFFRGGAVKDVTRISGILRAGEES